jgi:hypothetical protein
LNIGEAQAALPQTRIRVCRAGLSCSKARWAKVLINEKTSAAVSGAETGGLPVFQPDVAAIDLASEIHWACAPRL